MGGAVCGGEIMNVESNRNENLRLNHLQLLNESQHLSQLSSFKRNQFQVRAKDTRKLPYPPTEITETLHKQFSSKSKS